MLQTVSNHRGRGRQRHEYSKLDDASAPASANGASPVVVSEGRANPPDVMVNGFKPCRIVNDAWSAKGNRAGPQKHRRKPGDKSKSVITPSTACTVNGRSGQDYSLEKDTCPGKVGLPKGLDLEEPQKNGCEPSLQKKKQSCRKKFSSKKRNHTPLPPKEEENWEPEMEETKPVQPYGPEDKLGFVQNWLAPELTPPPPPGIGIYRPAKCHPRPIKWLCYSVATEPGQFSDAED